MSGLPPRSHYQVVAACEPDERKSGAGGNRSGAASYSRYSSDHQNSASIDDQQRECRQRAECDGIAMMPEYEFSDAAISGTKPNRAGLNALIVAAKEKRFSVLYFHSLSRLGRESVITMPLLKLLVFVYGIRVISLAEGVDSDRTGWEIMATICCLQNEQCIRELSANVYRGQEGTVFANLGVGDHRFGYTSIPSPNGEIIGRGRNIRPRMVYAVHEENARWVKQVFDWWVTDRRTLAWIVRELNRANVPTDHRSTTGKWSRGTVISLLRSKKYIGLWTWGVRKNVRNPLTGMVTQVKRSPIDVSRHNRDFPHLQIVENEIFLEAQGLLDANCEAFASCRNEKRQLNGSPKGRPSGHLLSCLMQCPCGNNLVVGGSKGRYLFCTKAPRGLCNCRTQLPRALASKLILDVIGQRILSNPKWVEAVYDLVLKTWQCATSVRPREIDELQSQIGKCDAKINRLVTQIEESDARIPAVEKRLAELEQEKAIAREKLRSLKSTTIARQTAPSREWVAEQLMELGNVLSGATPAAGPALRGLLQGPIQLTEIAVPGKKRCYWRGEFQIALTQTALATAPAITGYEPETVSELMETITIDFRHAQKWDHKRDEAWALYEQRIPDAEIAKLLAIPKSKIGEVLDSAAAERGQTRVDGRKRRHEAGFQGADKLKRQSFVDEVKRLWDDQLENQQIADRLGVCRDTITLAIREWHTNRGLPVPDGRTRRWLLPMSVIESTAEVGPTDDEPDSPSDAVPRNSYD